ncbi:SLATT domain-containing protein [Nocardiopsis dassonvillei]|uniref:SLATT domain-containing protein n=1 Tax=Nocardiopsis dassonvillei TaxID=2014 RepID=UPI0018DB32F1|nr:SLATT domain-containing protein [Nocardiopsis dassonvillei]
MSDNGSNIVDLNNKIVLLKSYMESARRKSVYGTLLIVAGAVGLIAYVVDYFAFDWQGIAPYVKLIILAAFIGLLIWGIALRAVPGVKVHESELSNELVTSARNGYRTASQLEIELRRIRDKKKEQTPDSTEDVDERRKSYREEATFYIEELRRESQYYRNVSNIVQGIVIVGSLLGSFMAASSFFVREYSWFVAINSLAIGIASGFAGYWKYKERSFYSQQTADLIEHEIESFDLQIGRYEKGDPEEKNLLFAREILRLRQDQKMREQNLDQPSSSGEEAKK